MKILFYIISLLLITLSSDLQAQTKTKNMEHQYDIAMNYLYGENGYLKSNMLAASYFEKSANQGYVSAQNNLAIMYLRGFGVSQNTNQAKKYFLMAAKQGHVNGQIQTALILLKENNKKDALRWLRLAAKSDDVDAYYQLGNTLISNKLSVIDQKEGVTWLEKAAQGNDTQAMMTLYHYYNSKSDQTNARIWLNKALSYNVFEAKKIQAELHLEN